MADLPKELLADILAFPTQAETFFLRWLSRKSSFLSCFAQLRFSLCISCLVGNLSRKQLLLPTASLLSNHTNECSWPCGAKDIWSRFVFVRDFMHAFRTCDIIWPLRESFETVPSTDSKTVRGFNVSTVTLRFFFLCHVHFLFWYFF